MTQNIGGQPVSPGRRPVFPKGLAFAILIGGCVAGTLDIFAASTIHHAPPATILQVIASGLLGAASFKGGAETVALGLLLQITMSLIIAAIFGIAGTRIPILIQRPLLFAPAYGVGIFFVMNYVVVPLSAAHGKHLPDLFTQKMFLELIAMVVFGLILAWSQKAFTAKRA